MKNEIFRPIILKDPREYFKNRTETIPPNKKAVKLKLIISFNEIKKSLYR